MAVRKAGAPATGVKQRKSWVDLQSRFWFRYCAFLIGLILRYWVRYYRAVGAEMIPSSGGIFLIANHTTAMDPFLVAYPVRARAPRGPGKVELFRNPIVGFLMRKIGIFPIRQDVADAGAVRTMIQLYRAGQLVIVYPEGGRSRTGELQPFFPDFARLVIRLRARLAPVGIAGGRDLLPMGQLVPRPRTPVAVVYGDPFDLAEFYDRELTPALAEEASAVLQRRVEAMVERARALRDEIDSMR